MRLGVYKASIPEGAEDSEGYVVLRHGQTYSISLRNGGPERCDVRVEIDGKYQGTWRLDPFQTGKLERPSHDQGRFTFYELNSQEGESIGLDSVSKSNLGLVSITFTPEKKEYQGGRGGSIERSLSKGQTFGGSLESFSEGPSSKGAYNAGGTGLSGESRQKFDSADRITLDPSRERTIHLRLVSKKKDSPRPLTEAPKSTPIPPTVA